MESPIPSKQEQSEVVLQAWPQSMMKLMKKSYRSISAPQDPSLAGLQHGSMCVFQRCCWGAASDGLILEVQREAAKAVASLVLSLHSFPSQTLITRKRKRESECIQVEMVGVHLEEFSQKEKDR